MTDPIIKPSEESKTEVKEETTIAVEDKKNFGKSTDQALISYFRVEIGEKVYDQRFGQIIGVPYLSFNTGQHDLGCFVINDIEDKIRSTLSEDDEVTIYIGFNKDEELEMMSGKISKFGRKLPDGLVVYVMDFSSESKNSDAKVVDGKTGEEDEDEDNEDEDIEDKSEVEKYSNLNKKGEKRTDVGSKVVKDKKDLKYESKSKIVTDKEGDVVLGESDVGAASREAAKVGDEVVVEGKTVKRVSPDGSEDTEISIDWIENRTAFIGNPTLTKRTDNQPQGSGGSWKVEGWNVDKKTTEGAIVVVPPKNDYDPDTEVEIVNQKVKLGDPIEPELMFAWGDATLGGKRLPDNEKTVDRIKAIAKTLDELNRKYSPNEKWKIISWLNPKGGARHEKGDAVSFVPQDPEKIYKELDPIYEGGLALYPKRFVHIDKRQDDGLPKLRFDF